MKKAKRIRATKSELAYIRRVERASVSERLARGELEVVPPQDYPKPLKRHGAGHPGTLQIRVSPRVRKKLESLSAREGVSPDELARRWVEEAARRHAS